MRKALRASLLCALLLSSLAPAEDVKITFLPPPLEGTLSVGIYSIEGKLVRVLKSEALEDAFSIGLNGLITSWDGKDNAGTELPSGKYFVRGYSVGVIEIEGVAYHGNDWYQDEKSPELTDLVGLSLSEAGLRVSARDLAGQPREIQFDREARTFSLLTDATAIAALREVPGKDGSRWSIEDDGVIQHKGDEVLRRLAIDEADPKPFAIAAAPDRDEIYLLERSATTVRLRALRLKQVKDSADGPAISEWEVFLQKQIVKSDSFAASSTSLGRPEAPAPQEKLRIALMPNELLQVAPAAVTTTVAIDPKGSLLQTADGLPLRRLTDTPRLQWAALTTERDGSTTLFQSDGAVIEEFRLRKLTRMMAFDAGEYEWTAGK